MLLVAQALLLTGSLATGAAAADLQHALGQSEFHQLPQSDEGKACDHCCACHYTQHLFSTTSVNAVRLAPAVGDAAVIARGAPAAPRPPDAFFRPPRIS